MPLIEIRGVSKIFRKSSRESVKALENVNLNVDENKFVTIIGPSGCGKTTLLRLLAGVMKPDEGGIFINAKEVDSPGRDRGFVFQDFGLFPWRTVIQNTEFGLELAGFPKEDRRKIAEKYIELVGLTKFRDYYPHELSGGMQQRVGIARALAIEPKIFLMDEPFGSLDAQTRVYMQKELLRIWSKRKRTVIFVTHNIDEAIYLSDEIAVMSCSPGSVAEIIQVDFPRPRYDVDVTSFPEYTEMRLHLWKMLAADDVMAKPRKET